MIPQRTSTMRFVEQLGGRTPSPLTSAVVISPDGSRIAVGDREGITVIDVASGATLAGWPTVAQPQLAALAFSPDGRRLASGTRDWAVVIWDVETAKQVVVNHDDHQDVVELAFSPDGTRLLAAIGTDEWGGFRIYDVVTGRIVLDRSFEGPMSGGIAWSPSGRAFGVARPWKGRGQLLALDRQTAVLADTKQDPLAGPLVLSADGRLVIHARGIDSFAVRDLAKRKVVHIASGNVAAIHPDGRLAFGTLEFGERATLSLVEAPLAGGSERAVTVSDGFAPVIAMVRDARAQPRFSRDGWRVAVAPRGAPAVYDLRTGERVYVRPLHVAVAAVAETRDHVLVQHADGELVIHANGSSRTVQPGDDARPVHPAPWAVLLPDGRVATCPFPGLDAPPELRDVATGEPVAIAAGARSILPNLAITHDGLVLRQSAQQAILWDPVTARAVRTMAGAARFWAAFGLAGSLRAWGLADRLVVWDLATGRELASCRLQSYALAVSPDATVGFAIENRVAVRRLDAVQEIIDALDLGSDPEPDQARALALSSDGRTLLVGTAAGIVLRYEIALSPDDRFSADLERERELRRCETDDLVAAHGALVVAMLDAQGLTPMGELPAWAREAFLGSLDAILARGGSLDSYVGSFRRSGLVLADLLRQRASDRARSAVERAAAIRAAIRHGHYGIPQQMTRVAAAIIDDPSEPQALRDAIELLRAQMMPGTSA